MDCIVCQLGLRFGSKVMLCPPQQKCAGGWYFQKVDAAQQGALAAAGWANKSRHRAFGNRDVYVVQDNGVVETLYDMLQLDHAFVSSVPP